MVTLTVVLPTWYTFLGGNLLTAKHGAMYVFSCRVFFVWLQLRMRVCRHCSYACVFTSMKFSLNSSNPNLKEWIQPYVVA